MRLLVTAAAAALGLAATTASAQNLSIGTNPQGSLAYASGTAIADVVGDAMDASFTVVPQGGPTAIIPALSRGRFQFAFANVVAASVAYDGGGPFRGREFTDLRVVAVVYPLRVGVFVPEDSSATTIEDLQGMRVASEFTTQANVGAFLTTSLAMGGLSYDDVVAVPVQNGPQSVDDLIDGAIDATLFSIGSGAVAKADAAVGVRFISLPDSEEALAILAERRPGASIATLEDGFAAGVQGPTNVIQAPFLVISTESVDEETVYRVTKALAENIPALAEAQGQFGEMALDQMGQSDLPVPYHPGAIRYYEEVGVWE